MRRNVQLRYDWMVCDGVRPLLLFSGPKGQDASSVRKLILLGTAPKTGGRIPGNYLEDLRRLDISGNAKRKSMDSTSDRHYTGTP